MSVTVHLRVSGRVQGVGYRDALRSEALARRVAGWVRNCRDGSVEAVLQGGPADVRGVLEWARHGPPSARVIEVAAQAAQGALERAYSGFELLPTA